MEGAIKTFFQSLEISVAALLTPNSSAKWQTAWWQYENIKMEKGKKKEKEKRKKKQR